jgi:hypothetical protein
VNSTSTEGIGSIEFEADPIPWIIVGLLAITIGIIAFAFLMKAELGL